MPLMNAHDSRQVPLAVTAKSTGIFTFTQLTFDFMSILPISQSLKSRGPRLQATPLQRQQKTYGPDVHITVQVEDTQMRLGAYFVDDEHLSLFEGERKLVQIMISNEGMQNIGEVYLVAGDEEELLLSQQVTAPGEGISSVIHINSCRSLRFSPCNVKGGRTSIGQLSCIEGAFAFALAAWE
jgi:hypothetical protein